MNTRRIKLVIPAFRESRRIEGYVRELVAAIEKKSLPFAIVVVDDGSGTDELTRTRSALAPLLEGYPQVLSLLALPKNQGKGAAIKAGWDADGSSEYLAFADADGSVSAGETIRVLNLALNSNGPVCYFASRIKMLGRTIHRSFLRHFCGRIFATVVDFCTHIPVYDSQCGCKVIPASAYHRIRLMLKESGFAFDVELMTALDRSGSIILEIPVDWSDVPGSKVSMVRDSLRMFVSCLAIQKRSKNWLFPPTN